MARDFCFKIFRLQIEMKMNRIDDYFDVGTLKSWLD